MAGGYPHKNLVNEIRNGLESLEPPLSNECCIYRVPKNLRRVSQKAYTPQLVSIGPFHHGNKALKRMEDHKWRYLEKVLNRVGNRVSLEQFVSYIKDKEGKIRRCYADRIRLNSDRFVKMVLVDAAFIIEYFIMVRDEGTDNNEYDLIFDAQLFRKQLRNDFLLLENQLPFFILEELYQLAFADPNVPFLKVALLYFQRTFRYLKITDLPTEDVKHFTDLVRHTQLLNPNNKSSTHHVLQNAGSSLSSTSSSSSGSHKYPNKYAHLGSFRLPLWQKVGDKEGSNEPKRIEHLYSASELREAGVKFRPSSSFCFLNVKYCRKDGVFEIPRFIVMDSTECVIRNVMALEQCHYPRQTYVCDFVVFMDYLINTDKDVEILVKHNILVNGLGSHHEAACLVNKLCLEIFFDPNENHYADIIRKLNSYYETPRHKWKASLRRVYFNTPWRGASTVAAVILLLLTLIQTICSIFSI